MLTATEYEAWADEYRVAQARVGGQAAIDVGSVWRGTEVLNPESERAFVRAAQGIVLDARAQSRSLLRDAWQFQGQALDLPELELLPLNLDETPDGREQVERSMAYQGPVRARRHVAAGETPEGAHEAVSKQVRGSAIRLANQPARETMKDEIEELQRQKGPVVGWLRITAPDTPCYFCVALASRGPRYSKNSFSRSAKDPRFKNAVGDAAVHDHCRCTIIMIRKDAMDDLPQSDYYSSLWYSLSEGDGDEAMKSFRRNYNALLKENGGRLPPR